MTADILTPGQVPLSAIAAIPSAPSHSRWSAEIAPRPAAIAALRAAGVPMALATDCNPGTSPLTSLLLAMNMGATLFRMTPAECLAGVTAHAATALGLADRGRIAPGMLADLAVWDCAHPAELSYRIGFNPLHARILGGDLD